MRVCMARPGAAPGAMLPLLLATATTACSPAAGADDIFRNPLAGLPALPKIHHCDGMGNEYPTDSSNPLQQDFARITHAWAVEINPIYLEHTAAGVSIWNQTVIDASLNKTEVIEATKLCAKANASITISYSPWGDWWNTYVPRRWNTIRAIDTCPDNIGEGQELRYVRERLTAISAIIASTNAQLGSSVHIGAVLLDSESYYINWSNETELRALERKDDLIYNGPYSRYSTLSN